MKKVLLFCFILFSIGYVGAQKNSSGQKEKFFKNTMAFADGNENAKFIVDSIYVVSWSGFVSKKQYSYYNEENQNVHNFLIGYEEWSGTTTNDQDSIYYDDNGNVTLYKTFTYTAGEWLPATIIVYTYDDTGRLIKEEEKRYDIDIEKWVMSQWEEHTFSGNNLVETLRYDRNSELDLKTVYSDFIAVNKPGIALLYSRMGGLDKPGTKIYYQYDDNENLISKQYNNISFDDSEQKSMLEEWIYNEQNQLTEYLVSYPDYEDPEVFIGSGKTVSEYDENNNLVKEINSYYSSYDESWKFSDEILYFLTEIKEPEPLAEAGSNWKYWMATERTYGFNKYEVVKDTVITAPLFETGRIITVNASWIEKTLYSSFSGNTDPNGGSIYYVGAFAAFRQGNKSYVWDENTREWFKWIDMDAKPGDKWVVPEIISGKGVNDYVEVSFVTTMDIDGQTVPYIYLIPACESKYSSKRDFTSRLNMSGYWNIDYWSLHTSPESRPNGYVYNNLGSPAEMAYGLICAKVNGVDFATDNLEEYVYYNNRNDYDNGVIDCDVISAPYGQAPQASGKRRYDKPEHLKEDNHIIDFQRYIAPEIEGGEVKTIAEANLLNSVELDSTGIIKIPVVVHVVHNPQTPEEKITAGQINKMIEALNDAYSQTHPDKVRDIFKGVIGNPHIEFALADSDPAGNPSNGIVYYETNEDYYPLQGWDIYGRYKFKFNQDSTARNWDHTKYANIYIVDLGGFDGVTNTGGFVTNPESNTTEEFELYKKWIAEGNPEFWNNWLKSEEATMLDGLTVDTWYTFGGVSEKNPTANFATAIHELGHYLGLRHVSLSIIENSDGSIETYDDGFTDTPYTHYNQYALVSCDQDIYQCGNIVQTENYMDYSLDCASMFTVQQSAFMRNFIQAVRPEFVKTGEPGSGIDDRYESKIMVYPNPARDYFNIEGDFNNASIIDSTGRLIMNITANHNTVYLNNFKAGMYFIVCELENGTSIVNKLIIE